jgi:hypothetical protein
MGEIIHGSFGRPEDVTRNDIEAAEGRPVRRAPMNTRVAELLLSAIDEVLEEKAGVADPLVKELQAKSDQMHQELPTKPPPEPNPPTGA